MDKLTVLVSDDNHETNRDIDCDNDTEHDDDECNC